MATVNLNETAKVKHILSLVQAINAKLDGDDNYKPATLDITLTN